MFRLRSLCFALLTVVLLPAAASAGMTGMLHPGFGGGVSVPAGDLNHAFDSGVHGEAFLGIGSGASPFGGRLAIDYQHFNAKSLTSSLPGGGSTTTSTGTGSILAGLVNLMYGVKLGPVKPYLTAGLGAFDLGSDPKVGQSTSKVHFGVNGGAGLNFKLGPVSAFVEGRYENLYTDKGLDVNATSGKKFETQVIPITFGVSL